MALVTAQMEDRVRTSFARQKFMSTIGARLASVADGEIEIVVPFNEALTQQHGFVHAGVVATIADNACGFAALTRMPENAAVLTTEFKMNLLAPATGKMLRAHGRVVRAGRKLTVCLADVFAQDDSGERHVAIMTASLMAVPAADNLRD
jgi:uncharacterized protein (TIGR00369 family)